jgi:hypothetical protein
MGERSNVDKKVVEYLREYNNEESIMVMINKLKIS